MTILKFSSFHPRILTCVLTRIPYRVRKSHLSISETTYPAFFFGLQLGDFLNPVFPASITYLPDAFPSVPNPCSQHPSRKSFHGNQPNASYRFPSQKLTWSKSGAPDNQKVQALLY